jgi:hypothetical protein
MTRKIELDLGTQARIVLDGYCRKHDLPHVDGNSFSGREGNQLWDFWSKGILVATVDMTKKTVKIVSVKKTL